jgi:hypothetical protein
MKVNHTQKKSTQGISIDKDMAAKPKMFKRNLHLEVIMVQQE